MNPIFHDQIAQTTHREYEAQYGQPQIRDAGEKGLSLKQKLALTLSTVALLLLFAAQFSVV